MIRIWAAVAVALLLTTGLVGCSSDRHDSCDAACQSSIEAQNQNELASLSSGADAENGAWTKSLTTTTCTEWTDVMSESQQFSVAKELIQALGAKDQSDDFARSFEADLNKDCGADNGLGLKLGEVAAALATLDTSDFN